MAVHREYVTNVNCARTLPRTATSLSEDLGPHDVFFSWVRWDGGDILGGRRRRRRRVPKIFENNENAIF